MYLITPTDLCITGIQTVYNHSDNSLTIIIRHVHIYTAEWAIWWYKMQLFHLLIVRAPAEPLGRVTSPQQQTTGEVRLPFCNQKDFIIATNLTLRHFQTTCHCLIVLPVYVDLLLIISGHWMDANPRINVQESVTSLILRLNLCVAHSICLKVDQAAAAHTFGTAI